MTLPYHIVIRPWLPDQAGHSISCSALIMSMLMLSACTTLGSVKVSPPSLDHSDNVIYVDDVDVLAISPAMEVFLDRYVLKYRNLDTRARLLTLSVVSNGVLGFYYDEDDTLTAEEAFSRRSGNCISHANMLVALARRAGLDARYQEIVIQPEWSNRDDTILINKHINVVLTSPHTSYHIDVSGREIRPDAKRRVLSDSDAKAMYFNNLGARALIENDLPVAYAYTKKAIETSAKVADAWVNLGVVLGRNKQLADAEQSHKTALQIDSRQYSAMNNLYGIYMYQNRTGEAAELKKRVDNHRRKNPYYLLMQSNVALEQSRFEDSLDFLRQAIKIKDDDHRLHFAMAKALYLSGDDAAAQRSVRLARQHAPMEFADAYDQPLDQLLGQP